jgi:competence protein ComEC
MGPARAPLFPIAAALALGIAAAPVALLPPLPLSAAGAALLIVAAAACLARSERLATVALLAGVVMIGALRASGPVLPADHIARRQLPSPVSLEGRLLSEPTRWAPDRMRLLLEVEAYRDGADLRPLTGVVQLSVYGEAPPLGEGQRIAVDARLHRPVGFRNPGAFDYPAHLRREGILLVGNSRGDRVTPLGPDVPPWPARVKRWAVETIQARLPDTSGALLAGLLLGERSALPPATDEAFRVAGVYHVLAVSGFNVALIASSVFATLGLAGIPRRATALVAAIVLIGFALVVGAQPSVLRATVMGLLLLASVLLDRQSQVMNALALAALVLLLWRPGDLADPGFLLSFAATWGIIYLAAPMTAFLVARGWPVWLASALAVSLGAQLAVTPVMLAFFNQLSLIGIAANLLVVPLAGPATTLGMLTLLVSLASDAAAGLLWNALWLILLALRAVVWAAALVPGAMVHLPAPAWGAIAAWYAALLLGAHLSASRLVRGAMAFAILITAALSVWPWIELGPERLRILFLDVGQGDATLIELPEGRRILVDGGSGGPQRFDVGERVLSPVLWNRPALSLDVVALTHSDVDHAGGLAAVLKHFAVGQFWESGWWTAAADATRLALERSGTPRRVLRAGDRIWIGEALLTILNPDGREPAALNDESLVMRLDWRGLSLLLTGDLGGDGEARVQQRGGPLRVSVLKVAHHGSRFSSTGPFLDAVHPAVAVVSVGARNPFRHPNPQALGRLAAVGARVYRTDRDGAVIVESDGTRLWVTRWASGTTEAFELDAVAPVPERTTAPGT